MAHTKQIKMYVGFVVRGSEKTACLSSVADAGYVVTQAVRLSVMISSLSLQNALEI